MDQHLYKNAIIFPDELHHDSFIEDGVIVQVRLFIYTIVREYISTLLVSSFWTSRGHRCRPFSAPVLAFNFYRV